MGFQSCFGSSNVLEHRDSRFGELDAMIAAKDAARMSANARPKHKLKRRKAAAVPPAIRKEVAQFARELKRQHKSLFITDPKLKDRVGRMLRSMLPPKQNRGRPALDSVTMARLLKRFRRKYPSDSAARWWARVYPIAIDGYAGMPADEKRKKRQLLRDRVRRRRNKVRARSSKSADRRSPRTP